MDEKFINAFDGMMLGDGCISKCAWSKNYFYIQLCKYKEWLDVLGHLLRINGIENRICTASQYYLNQYRLYYQLYSKYCVFLTEQHERWYMKWYDVDDYAKRLWHQDKDGEWYIWKKTVPDDIMLTPHCVLNWYLGDGCFHKNDKVITLHTEGFVRDDCYLLSCILGDRLDMYCYAVAKDQYHSDQFIVVIPSKSVNAFFEYIKYCRYYVPCCYDYKFNDHFLYGFELSKETKDIETQICELQKQRNDKVLEIKKKKQKRDLRRLLLKCEYGIEFNS